MLEKTKEAIKNEQSETLATLGTQDTGAMKNVQSETLATLGTQDTGAIKNEQSETLTTLGTQDTGAIKNENPRRWHHWVLKTQGQSRMNNQRH